MRVGVKTDVGKVRRANEDAYWVSPPWFAVADGMGGHVAGEVASELAVNAVSSVIASGNGSAEDLIATAVRRANEAILLRGEQEVALTGMGTTLTMVKVEERRCFVGHVGDSRCYRLHRNDLKRLTHDHSVVEELVRTGTLSEHEAMAHPQRNLLTRALGGDPDVKPDIIIEEVQPGDKLMLCTDGLTSVISDYEVREVLLSASDPNGLAARLVQMANERGGPDNITVVVVELPTG